VFPIVPSPAGFEYLDNPERLADFCARLASSRRIALDTEFVGENTFYPELELIQLAGDDGAIGIVDARTAGKMEPLGELMADSGREKILHSGSQDIPLLGRHLGAPPRPLFDTQLAAAMVGLGAQVSYAGLAEEFAGARLGKKHTVSDWSRRPLLPQQLAYAADDVRHLHAIRDGLAARLEKLGRMEWFEEEQERRITDAAEPEVIPDEEFHRTVKEWGKLRGRELAVLRELALWREAEAKRKNMPRRRVLPDQALVNLARMAPTRREEARDLRHIPQGLLYRYIDDILPVIERANKLPRDQWPRRAESRTPDVPPGIVEVISAVVRTTAEQEQIAPALLATTSELTALVNNRRRLDDLDLPVLKGWRRELIGEKLIELLDGRLILRIHDGDRLAIESADQAGS